MTDHVDHGPKDAPGLAVILPGRNYPPSRPLLQFAGQAVADAGWRVREVWWDTGGVLPDDPPSWVAGELGAAVGSHEGPVLVVAKSLGTWAAPYAAGHGYAGVWLTPLLREPVVVDGIAASPARQLLVGGDADPFWDTATADRLARVADVEVAEVPAADHGLIVEGDAVATVEAHREMTRRLVRWLSR